MQKNLKIFLIKTKDIYTNLLVPSLVQGGGGVLLMTHMLELFHLSC